LRASRDQCDFDAAESFEVCQLDLGQCELRPNLGGRLEIALKGLGGRGVESGPSLVSWEQLANWPMSSPSEMACRLGWHFVSGLSHFNDIRFEDQAVGTCKKKKVVKGEQLPDSYNIVGFPTRGAAVTDSAKMTEIPADTREPGNRLVSVGHFTTP
jgi:hypothetical protein